MKKIKLSAIFTMIIGAMGFYACSDEFLEIPVQGALSEQVLTNPEGAEASLIATYSLLDGYAGYGGWGGAGSNWIFGSVASDDAYKGSEPGDQGPTTDIEF